MPDYGYDKSRLSAGRSFPLKRTELDRALDEADIGELFMVRFVDSAKSNNTTVIAATYHGEAWFNAASGKCSIDLMSVHSHERAEVHEMLVREMLPEICRWIKAAEKEGNVWRATDHYKGFGVIDDDGDTSLPKVSD